MMNRIALIVTAACLLAIGNQAVAQKKAERYSVTERDIGGCRWCELWHSIP